MTEMNLDFATGAQEAEQFVKDQAEARKAARGGANWFGLKDDGDMAVIRFLIPHTKWIYVKQHDFLKPKAAPGDKPSEREWPKSVGTICRYTLIGPKENRRPAFDECYACDHMKNDKGRKEISSTKIWTLAAGRTSTTGTDELAQAGRIHPSQVGQRVIIDDAELVDEFDDNGNKTGKKIWRKKIWIVNQSVRNFFSPLITVAGLHGTITDRDYAIVRKGEKGGNKVDYEAIDLGPFDVAVPGANGETETIRYDTADPRIAALYEGHGTNEAELRKIINRRISKDYYNFFLDPRVNMGWKDFYKDSDEESGGSTEAAPATPSPEQQAGNVATAEPTQGVSKERLEELRRQVMESTGSAPTAAPAAVPVAPLPTT